MPLHKNDRLVVTDGIPITVHSAKEMKNILKVSYNVHNYYLVYSPRVHSMKGKPQGDNHVQIPHNP